MIAQFYGGPGDGGTRKNIAIPPPKFLSFPVENEVPPFNPDANGRTIPPLPTGKYRNTSVVGDAARYDLVH